MEWEDNEINIILKIPFHKRTSLNYTHNVNIDNQINSISTWRKSKIKFNITLIKNILTLGILHIISLFYPKLYLKLYCKPCSPKESDFFLIEDINGNSSLCKSIHKRPKIINSSSMQKINFSKSIFFEYNAMRYEYDERKNTVFPIFFNISSITNNDLIYKYCEGLSYEEINNISDKYGKNEMKLNNNIIYVYFIKQNLKQVILTTLSSICFYAANQISFGIYIFFLSLLTILIRVLYYYIRFKQLYSDDDNSLDGRKKMKNIK